MINTIQKFLNKRGITIYRFAEDTGISKTTAYRMANDQSYVPTQSVLSKICDYYEVQPSEFLAWVKVDQK